MHKFQLVDFLINPPQKRYFGIILKAIDCQALFFRIFRPPLNRPGLSNKRFRLWLALLTQSNLIRYAQQHFMTLLYIARFPASE